MDLDEMKARVRAANAAGTRMDGGGDDRPPVYVEDGRAVYRASAMGLCTRALWLARTGVPQSPTPQALRDAYLTGANNEDLSLAMFEERYYVKVTDRQLEYEVPVPGANGAVIRGHIDGLGVETIMERTGVVEAKNIADADWGRRSIGMYPGWEPQVHLAMRGTETRMAWEVFGRKVDGVCEEVAYAVVEYDRRVIGRVFDRVREVEAAVDAGTAILCEDEVWGCPYWQLHEGVEEAVITDQRMAVLAAQIRKHAEMAKREDEAAKALRAELGQLLEDQKIKSGVVEGTGTGRYRVTWVTPTRSTWDDDALARDGVELDRYKVKTEGTPYVKVTPAEGGDGATDG